MEGLILMGEVRPSVCCVTGLTGPNSKVRLQFYWYPAGELQFVITEIFSSKLGKINSSLTGFSKNLTIHSGNKAR